MDIDNKQILNLAVPSIISNITVPLLGLVDLTIIGHIGDDRYISAIAIGSMIFNVIYWLFGFLRMGTSGMTAQAFGSGNGNEQVLTLMRTLAIGISFGLFFVLIQKPLLAVMLYAMNTPEASQHLVRLYFDIVIWGSPAMMGLFGLNGWFIGMQDTRTPMMVAILQNIFNILASLAFVFLLGWQIEGVAAGTVIAQWMGFLLAVTAMTLKVKKISVGLETSICHRVFDGQAMKRFFSVNGDIFLRTVCLVAVNLFFTSAGGRQGTMMLAVNTLLITLFTLFSYFMDGFAYAGEALSGRYYGADDKEGLYRIISHLFRWGGIMVIVFTLLYIVGGTAFLHLLTSDNAVVKAAEPYLPWAMAIPLCGVAAFIYDGIYIGITATRGMLVSSVVATACFFLVYFIAWPYMRNNGLWLAFLIYLMMRGMMQYILLKRNILFKLP